MKKLTKILTLALAVVVLALALSSCALISKGLQTISDKLEEAGIEISFGGISKDYDAVKEKLEEAGYTVELTKYEDDREDGKVAFISASKEVDDKVDGISILYFKDEDSAKAEWDKQKGEFEKNSEMMIFNSDPEYAQDGTIVYFGTKNAVKAAK